MNFLTANIGENRLRELPNQTPEFTQNKSHYPQTQLENVFDTIPNPYNMYKNISNNTTNREMNNCSENDDSFILSVLENVNPYVSLYTLEDKLKCLEKFKKQSADDLDNENQLFRKFGFSKKKDSINIHSMKKEITQVETNGNLSETVLLYLCLLGNVSLVIIKEEDLKKQIINYDEKFPLFIMNNRTSVNLTSKQGLEELLKKIVLDKYKEGKEDIKKLSYLELRTIDKFLNIHNQNVHKKKDDIIDYVCC